jgi:hypothetical protein
VLAALEGPEDSSCEDDGDSVDSDEDDVAALLAGLCLSSSDDSSGRSRGGTKGAGAGTGSARKTRAHRRGPPTDVPLIVQQQLQAGGLSKKQLKRLMQAEGAAREGAKTAPGGKQKPGKQDAEKKAKKAKKIKAAAQQGGPELPVPGKASKKASKSAGERAAADTAANVASAPGPGPAPATATPARKTKSKAVLTPAQVLRSAKKKHKQSPAPNSAV